MEYVDASKVSVQAMNSDDAKKIIVEKHYTHAWTTCSQALGIYYETDNEHDFFEGKVTKLIGVLVYGNPVGSNSLAAISDGLKKKEVLELTRLYIDDGYGKNIESLSISKSIKWLKQYWPKLKYLISFADPEQEHVGTIYQATNWLYTGISAKDEWYIIKGERIHPRTVGERYGTRSMAGLKHMGIIAERTLMHGKHRYIYVMKGGKQRKRLLRSLHYDTLPYPKQYTKTVTTIGNI